MALPFDQTDARRALRSSARSIARAAPLGGRNEGALQRQPPRNATRVRPHALGRGVAQSPEVRAPRTARRSAAHSREIEKFLRARCGMPNRNRSGL